MNEKYQLQTLNNNQLVQVDEIINFGNDVTGEMRSAAMALSRDVENRSDNSKLLNSLDKILQKIDYKELKFVSNTPSRKGFLKVVDKVVGRADKIMDKYVTVSSELNSMYVSIKAWENDLKKNAASLQQLEKNTVEIKDALEMHISYGQEYLDTMPEDDEMEIEKKNIMNQKMQEFIYSSQICSQTLQGVKVLQKTNYTIYKKLVGVHNITMPIIQQQINTFKILKDQAEMIESLQIIDRTRNTLMTFGAKETVKLGKQSVEMLGNSEEDFRILNESVEILKEGTREIMNLQEQKNLQISDNINEKRLLA